MNLPDEWSTPDHVRTHGWRAWLVVAALAGGAGALTWYAARYADWSGLQHSRAELTRAAARASAARVARAPVQIATGFTPVTLADLVMRLSRLAGESGLRLRTLERATAAKAKGTAEAPRFHMSASGDFLAMRRWLAGLPRLPALVVPRRVEARREAGGGVLEVDLQLFPALPGAAGGVQGARAAALVPAENAPANDPFGTPGALSPAGPASDHWQLAGLLSDARHGVALFEQSGDTRVLMRGHALDEASLKSVDARGALLAQANGKVHRIELRERVTP